MHTNNFLFGQIQSWLNWRPAATVIYLQSNKHIRGRITSLIKSRYDLFKYLLRCPNFSILSSIYNEKVFSAKAQAAVRAKVDYVLFLWLGIDL